MKELVTLASQHLNLEISPHQEEQFSLYRRLLIGWNEKHNLTAITDPQEIIIKHFFDSLTCLRFIHQPGHLTLADIGTGAGFPGIPLKILRPDLSLTLVESVKKKVVFCSLVIDELDLPNTQVIQARAEELGQDHQYREKFDWVVARAVANMAVLVEYLLPLVKVGGHALSLKGRQDRQEIDAAQLAVSTLGGEFTESIRVALPGNYGQRVIYRIKKIQPTPPAYPRRAGVPIKKPIRN